MGKSASPLTGYWSASVLAQRVPEMSYFLAMKPDGGGWLLGVQGDSNEAIIQFDWEVDEAAPNKLKLTKVVNTTVSGTRTAIEVPADGITFTLATQPTPREGQKVVMTLSAPIVEGTPLRFAQVMTSTGHLRVPAGKKMPKAKPLRKAT